MQELIECEDVFIDGCPRELIVSESDGEDKHIKNICSLVGETFGRGQYVRWRDAVWLITSQSVHNQLYVKGEMTMCNYPLRWIGKDGRVVEKYCYTADSPIYRTGVKKDEELQVPAMQKTVVLPFDDETSALRRGARFIID